jgi:hypothetical protein
MEVWRLPFNYDEAKDASPNNGVNYGEQELNIGFLLFNPKFTK